MSDVGSLGVTVVGTCERKEQADGLRIERRGVLYHEVLELVAVTTDNEPGLVFEFAIFGRLDIEDKSTGQNDSLVHSRVAVAGVETH